MSWGFFVNLELSLPKSEWAALSKKAPKEFVVPEKWPDASDFAKSFRSKHWSKLDDSFQKIFFAKAPAYKDKETVRAVDAKGDVATVRFLVLLDKSVLENAEVVASLFHAASSIQGATGKLVVVNDGTGPDENGWEFSLAKGKIKAKKVGDHWAYVDVFTAELYGDPD